MQLEDYFDFVEPDVIRLRGHRIGLEHVVELFNRGHSPEMIVAYFGTVSLEEVYAAITYYLRNKSEVDAYLERLDQFVEERIREADANPSPVAVRLRALQQQRERERDQRQQSGQEERRTAQQEPAAT
jgi:uncharacterized protein (DUF433 family)